MHRLRVLWSDFRSSFWFVPLLIVIANIIFASALIETESAISDRWQAQWPRLFGVEVDGALQMLSTLAGSMISVLGITFSMTLVALSLASSQYTSRILGNFMSSRVTQVTLGVFAGVFAYCLVVLKTIHGGDAPFVPGLAVFFAFVLALCSIGVIVYFIHHIASSIQASTIIASTARATIASIEHLLPEESRPGVDGSGTQRRNEAQARHALAESTWHAVPAASNGYIQNVDTDALVRLAHAQKAVLRMESGIGGFVVQRTALASLSTDSPVTQDLIDAVNMAYNVGRHRAVDQDPAFGIRQLVDMALKALSPGINDTSTAVMCIDYLTAVLAALSIRRFPESLRYEEDDLRLVAIVPTFEGLLAEAFDQIRNSATGNAAVVTRMLGALEKLATLTANRRRRQAIQEQMQFIVEVAGRTVESQHDRDRIARRLRSVRVTLRKQAAESTAQDEEQGRETGSGF
jgi:uncharacterized membrane protein